MQKVPPITLRKMAGNGRLIAISKAPSTNVTYKAPSGVPNGGSPVQQQHAGGPSGYIAVRQNLSSQTIDLTDEEETKSTTKAYVTNNPPALSSITNKPSTQQYTITHQRVVQKPTTIGNTNELNILIHFVFKINLLSFTSIEIKHEPHCGRQSDTTRNYK